MADLTAAPAAPDVLPASAPALSATSDVPVGAPSPEAPAPAAAAAPEAVAEAPQTAPEAPEAAAAPTDAAPAPKGVGKRLTALEAELQAERQARQAAQEQIATALRTIEALSAKPVAPTPDPVAAAPEPVAPRPRRDQFDNPDSYDAAVDQWHASEAARVARETVRAEREAADQRATAERTRAEQEAAQAKQRQEVEALSASWTAQRTAAVEKYQDFADVVENPALTITPAMAATIMQTDNGADLAYHLGKNPAEATRIAGLPPVRQAFELGRIAAALNTPKAVVTNAPAPITPLGATARANPKSPHEESMEEYAARRMAEMAAERKQRAALN